MCAFRSDRDWAAAVEGLLCELADQARALGGNALVGLELEADPYSERDGAPGLWVYAVGNCMQMRRAA